MPYVVDANVINLFQQERLEGLESSGHISINLLMSSCCIALDESGLCQQEWLDCAGGSFPLALIDWINDMLVAQRIRLFALCTDSKHKEFSNLGIPKKDHKWIRLAIGAGSSMIVTDDIDLFDPTKKNSDAATKKAIKESRKGPVSKYLKKTYKIAVVCPIHVPEIMAS